MNPALNELINAIFRWLHVVAGVAWVGHLYFFNFVNGPFAKTMDAATKKAVVPELMPRALFWFRWGAAWTFITGIMLFGAVYYMGGFLFEGDAEKNYGLALGLSVLALVAIFLYDVIQKQMKGTMVANAICLILLAAVYVALRKVGHFSSKALYIHVGAILGTVMAMNVWMRIWPAQKKIIAAIKAGTAPDADVVALAGLRSRQNTFMSVPLIFFMVSNHFPLMFGDTDPAHRLVGIPMRDVTVVLIILAGFGLVHLLYKKSASVQGL